MKRLPLFLNTARFGNHANADGKRWFDIRNETDTAVDISIMEDIGMWGTSAREFLASLKGLGEKAINLYIYSPGGSVFEGTEIFNALKAHKGVVNVKLGALCASIATVIAMSGKNIQMPKNGHFMIHNPFVYTGGEYKDLIRVAGLLKDMKDNIVDVYRDRTGLTKTAISEMMDDETWMTAEKALENKFIDEIIEDAEDDDDKVNNRFDLLQFKNCAFAKKPPTPTNVVVEQPQPKIVLVPTSASPLEKYTSGKTRLFAQ